jgi:hypothetical protein
MAAIVRLPSRVKYNRKETGYVEIIMKLIYRVKSKARFMLECDVCDTERGDTEPVAAFVFML